MEKRPWIPDLEVKPDFEQAMKRIYGLDEQEMIDCIPVRFIVTNAEFARPKRSENEWSSLRVNLMEAASTTNNFKILIYNLIAMLNKKYLFLILIIICCAAMPNFGQKTILVSDFGIKPNTFIDATLLVMR